ncbi:DNA alkylation repair protein [Marinagarivorans algicola]|uniref:DNA alkylation repair protein n=1 Tax=Marinagarivorans algicola TaxID=1513270 RepID=UPI0006B92263|nr:DNA alkylation repair protein [Marinagarivorans algicola]
MKQGLSHPAIMRISQSLAAIEPSFSADNFEKSALQGLDNLALKARVNHIIACLHQHLPSFEQFAPKLCQLPQHWDQGDPNEAQHRFAAWPIIDYVAVHGIEHPELAFTVLEAITHLFSAEFAIRPFIERYPTKAFAQLKQWTTSTNEHVRRLASEGCRPRLPWGIQLKALVADPSPIFAILEPLKSDSSLYVRKSVANNLNDISKDHPITMLQHCAKWQRKCTTTHTQWIIKHACRTLIKAGHPQCLALLGFNPAQINGVALKCSAVATVNSPLSFEFTVMSTQDQALIIDYAIDFLRANGRYNRKVFKLKTFNATQGQHITLKKHYSFKPISTRRYYLGQHTLSLQINGKIVASQCFTLK